jgi:hypothetical protein
VNSRIASELTMTVTFNFVDIFNLQPFIDLAPSDRWPQGIGGIDTPL